MKTLKILFASGRNSRKLSVKRAGAVVLILLLSLAVVKPARAHCDSYDGPVITDARKALVTNEVKFVLKWISKEQEPEITSLFRKTYGLKNGDKEIYSIVEKYFFETLVRLHRETEGAPYTGLKEAGTAKAIVKLSDDALLKGQVDPLISNLNHHIAEVVREKFAKVSEIDQVKDQSVQAGREYVAAYVDYTHTLEAIHDVLDHSNHPHSGH